MGSERDIAGAAALPLEARHQSRLAEVYVRHAPEGIRFAYLLTDGWIASVGFSDPDGTRFRTLGVDASIDHIGIGCFESSSVGSARSIASR